MRLAVRRCSALLVGAVLIVLATGSVAHAKEFFLPHARVDATVTDTGAVMVKERLTYSFSGDFSGAYREIPLREGETISDISVKEGRDEYSPGASTELGSFGLPGTFGANPYGEDMRIVWHYSALNETRTFTVSYTLHGLAVAYDDVVDVNLRVWGDEWDVRLDVLDATMTLPENAPGDVRVWGHPGSVEGRTKLHPDGSGADLHANGIPGHKWVEMRVVFPTSALSSTADAKVEDGDGLESILAEERAFARAQERIEMLKRNAFWLVPVGLLLCFLPAGIVCFIVWRRYGREREVLMPPGYVTEPPGDEPPALVPALTTNWVRGGSGDAFAATLFDLIRRKHIDAMTMTTIKKTWGGIRQEDVSDLGLQVKVSEEVLTPYEKTVKDAVAHAAIGKERLPLTEFDDEIKKDPAYYQTAFNEFGEHVKAAIKAKG
ncbi:MAG: hypothetical protein QOK47_478, partial [Actinomycetota bacterium]|nr:hypothetical protein [Actinomycetota bacterium]